MLEPWQAVAKDKQAQLLERIPSEWRLSSDHIESITVTSNTDVTGIPKTCGLLSDAEIDITESYSAVELLSMIHRGQLTSVEVTKAFCKRAAIAHQLVNCCTELPFEQALKRAKACDDYLASEGKPMGPLHGLPVSVKDLFYVPDTQTTCGYIAFASESYCSEARGITAALLDLGAVLHAKTNMSQMGFAFDTDNNLFGRTLNPLRTGLTPGGSSGGESALIALRGSILGVGTDTLGSLRTPAHCTGLCTIKPSPYRIPHGGRSIRGPGVPGNPAHVGPLAHCIDDLRLFMRTVIQCKPWKADSSLTSMPWMESQVRSNRLRIGCIEEDVSHPLHPPMLRAMKLAIRQLETAGHEIIPLETGKSFPSLAATIPPTFRLAVMDPESTSSKPIKEAGEPLVPSVKNSMPSRERMQMYAPSLQSLIQANIEREKLAEEVRLAFVEGDLDVIMMPVHETVAPRVDTWNTATYMALWNLLPHPAVVLPFGKACEADDRAFLRKDVDLKTPYHAEEVEGMPCSLQFVGRPLQDEELLAVAEKLVSHL